MTPEFEEKIKEAANRYLSREKSFAFQEGALWMHEQMQEQLRLCIVDQANTEAELNDA